MIKPGKNLQYIQVRGGFVYVTNASVALKIPEAEVFGEDLTTPDDTFYIEASEWKSANMHKAVTITREGRDYFVAHDRNEKIIGRLKLVTEKEYTEGLKLHYPDINTVIPDLANICPIDRIALCPGQLELLCKAMGVPYVALAFSGIERALLVFSNDTDAVGICMPAYVSKWPWKDAPKPEAEAVNDYEDLL